MRKSQVNLKLIEQHKALIITFLLIGSVVCGMFTIQLKQQDKLITETYYLLEPELTEDQKKFKEFATASTDKAFNEDQEFKNMMRNFKTISANDFKSDTKRAETLESNAVEEEYSRNQLYKNNNGYALNSEETASYKKLQDELNKRIENRTIADEHAKQKGTLTFSLVGRTLFYYKTPRYLCEEGGKIVVSIRVNEKGKVFDAFINGSSNSNNPCLIQHAIDYAKSVRFNESAKNEQLGTISFLFKSKS